MFVTFAMLCGIPSLERSVEATKQQQKSRHFSIDHEDLLDPHQIRTANSAAKCAIPAVSKGKCPSTHWQTSDFPEVDQLKHSLESTCQLFVLLQTALWLDSLCPQTGLEIAAVRHWTFV